jgi:hypothetical protein
MSLQDAKVVSSKFLQLKDKLDKELSNNKTLYAPGPGNGFTDHTQEMDIITLVRAFGELCELLHELVIEEDS